MAPGKISILSIEIDGHFHGSSNVPRPWVAEILGIDSRYGGGLYEVSRLRGNSSKRYVAREFLEVRDGKRTPVSSEDAILRASEIAMHGEETAA